MASILISGVNVVSGDETVGDVSIFVEDGVIAEVGRELSRVVDDVIDASGLTVFSGFVDVHIHGAVGVDVNEADVDGLVAIAEFLAKHGVTSWVPTLVPDSDEKYKKIIDAIDGLMEVQEGLPIAQAVGVHYEGVFANEKMCGALRPEFFRSSGQWSPTTPSTEAVSTPPPAGGELGWQLPRLNKGVHVTTLAPEIDGGIELTKELVKQGWIVSIGHTNADAETLDEAFAAGARHLTHFYNAMTGMHHRDVGVVGWALANDVVTFDIIADGVHVHPKMLEFACRAKTADKVSLISDSVAPTGLGDGEFEIWGEKVSVAQGRTQNERGSIAGSVIPMLDAVKRMRFLGFSDTEVAKMASLNPARLLEIDKTHGSIEVGKRADLVAIDKHGNVKLTMIGGQIAFSDL